MQGFEEPQPGLWDAGALTGHLLPEGGMFAFLARHRGEVFPDADYADLFAVFGRPSLPATRMAAVLTLQELHGFSDRETAEAVRFDLRWKMALGLGIEDPGFDASVLVYWRRRIAASQRPHRVNDAIRQVIKATGVLKGRRRRTADSTIFADAVATQDTVTQLIAAIRRAARQVPGAAAVIAAGCGGFDYSQGRRPVIDWSDPQAAAELVSALVNDADTIVSAFRDAELDEQAASALALLGLVAGQDVEPAEGSDGTDGRWRIAKKTAEGRMVSQVDPESRHARKNRHTLIDGGYRAHLSAEPSTGLITDEELTMASGEDNSDAAAAARFVAREHAGSQPGGQAAGGGVPGDADDGQLTWYADSAYGTGELRAAIGQAGDEAVIKPKPLKRAVEGGFTVDDFTVDHQAGTATCPAGTTRRITPAGAVNFGAACKDCPLRSRCTTAAAGKILHVGEHDQRLRQARRDWAGPDLRRDYRATRPSVERTVAHVALVRGRRLKLRYRGTSKNHAWLKRRTAAVNLRTLLRHGLARRNGTWTLTAPPA
jgi:IS5 family transposase